MRAKKTLPMGIEEHQERESKADPTLLAVSATCVSYNDINRVLDGSCSWSAARWGEGTTEQLFGLQKRNAGSTTDFTPTQKQPLTFMEISTI